MEGLQINATARLLTRSETRNKSSKFFRVSVANRHNKLMCKVVGLE